MVSLRFSRGRDRKAGFLRGLLLAALLLSSCSNLRYLEEGQYLYTGSRVVVESDDVLPEKPETELRRVVRPVPNQKFLFWRPRLWFYNIAGEPEGRGLRHLLRNRLGRPPVLFDEENAVRSARLMENRLFNMGYFDGEVSYQVRLKEKTASVDYQVNLRAPYSIRRVYPLDASSPLSGQINPMMEESLLRPGDPYRLDVVKMERQRLDRKLKDLGYYYFHPDYLIFLADSTPGGREIDLHLRVKVDVPAQALQAYRMGTITVIPDYLTESMPEDLPPDTVRVRDGLYVVDGQRAFRPDLFGRSVMFEQGRLYDTDSHDQSLGRLMGLGVFRFVNFRFSPSHPAAFPSDEDNANEMGLHGQALAPSEGMPSALDLRILLSPMKKKSLSAEIRGVSKSNNFAGPGFTASFSNMNLFGGAEMLRLSAGGNFETLISRRLDPVNAWEAGVEAELIYPGFVAPVFRPALSTRFVPRTRFSLSWDYFSRTDAFNLNSLKLQYGFDWNSSYTVRHSFSPALLNLFILGSVREGFDRLLTDMAIQRRGLFEQFIIGSRYAYYYNSQQRPGDPRRQDVYFNLNLDVSGNLAYLVADHVIGAQRSAEGDFQLAGQSFSQFSRADFDLRYYLRLGQGHRLATRLIAGAGIPYGNSDQMPYVKLFTIGGVNSIRAFHPRSVGPGAYNPPDSLVGRFNPYQAGELKLEINLEYRFNISGMFKGAVFADAGNIWRLEANEQTPGGEFRRDMFLRQLALGTGAGLRIDVNFFVLRLDFAFPLAVPYNDRFPEPVQPLKRQWRRDNLVFNLAIGYPF